MFLTEQKLKDSFWKNYNYSGRALRYQFECSIRNGDADLVTVETFQDKVQFNAFEFKLTDIKKAILQAKENSRYVHKSWIVVPSEKENLIQNKYSSYLKELKYIGVITVESGGKWKMIHRPIMRADDEIELVQSILKMLLVQI